MSIKKLAVILAFCFSSELYADEVYFTKGKDCQNNIIKRIDKAKKIRVSMYILSNTDIIDSLVSALNRGADIALVLDRKESIKKYSGSYILKEKGAKIHISNTKFTISHNKYAVIDDKEVIVGSYNWTGSATNNNSEDCLFYTSDPLIIKKYSDRWTELYNLGEQF